MSTSNRPLSPHLQVYRLPLTALVSISHRITGVALSAGAVVLAVWLLAIASGPQAYAGVSGVIGSFVGKLILFLFTAALYFHMCNGVRHLFWDAGHGFEIGTADASGKAVIAASIALTLLTWGIAIGSGS